MDDLINSLESKGYAVLPNVFSKEECYQFGEALDLLEKQCMENESGFLLDTGVRQRQLLNVHYLQPDLFLPQIANPRILETVSKVLNDKFVLSNFNASRPLYSKEKYKHRIHIDSRKPNPNFEHTYQIVANICIDDFTETNGSTVVVEGSYKTGKDPRNLEVAEDQLVKAVAPKGSVIFMLGQTWHDVGGNTDGCRRWSIIAYYSCWWIKPTYDFVGACTEDVFQRCNDEQKTLLGFNTRPPVAWDKRQNTVTNIKDLPASLNEAKLWDGY